MKFHEVQAKLAEDRRNGIHRLSASILSARSCRMHGAGFTTYALTDHYYPRLLRDGTWQYGMWVATGNPWAKGETK